MKIKEFYHAYTFTFTYVVYDETSKDAVIIDSVLDYDPNSSQTSSAFADSVIGFIKDKELTLHYILETHAHADHLTAAPHLKKTFPKALVGIGRGITQVQKTFKPLFNLPGLETDGRPFDTLMEEGKDIQAGSLTIKTLETPGHTPACSSFLIGDAVFTGDLIFLPDMGTGRCDFPQGSAEDSYHSIQKIYALPDATRVFVGHDYQPDGRAILCETTVAEQKEKNILLKAKTPKDAYVSARTTRDKNLKAPRLLLPAIQININGGRLPEPEDNGTRYLKIPIS